MDNNTYYPLIIIGGGPIGIACALEAKKRNIDYLVLEKGTEQGKGLGELFQLAFRRRSSAFDHLGELRFAGCTSYEYQWLTIR